MALEKGRVSTPAATPCHGTVFRDHVVTDCHRRVQVCLGVIFEWLD
jgi:hypothetical protein